MHLPTQTILFLWLPEQYDQCTSALFLSPSTLSVLFLTPNLIDRSTSQESTFIPPRCRTGSDLPSYWPTKHHHLSHTTAVKNHVFPPHVSDALNKTGKWKSVLQKCISASPPGNVSPRLHFQTVHLFQRYLFMEEQNEFSFSHAKWVLFRTCRCCFDFLPKEKFLASSRLRGEGQSRGECPKSQWVSLSRSMALPAVQQGSQQLLESLLGIVSGVCYYTCQINTIKESLSSKPFPIIWKLATFTQYLKKLFPLLQYFNASTRNHHTEMFLALKQWLFFHEKFDSLFPTIRFRRNITKAQVQKHCNYFLVLFGTRGTICFS